MGKISVPLVTALALLLVALYSRVKGSGLLASVVLSIQVSFAGVAGWLAAGGRNLPQFAIMFAALTIFGIRQNLIAGLRDIDSDPKVGNVTTAVRLGLAGSVRWVLILAAITAIGLIPVSVTRGNWPGLVWCLGAAAVALASIPGMTRRLAQDEVRTRRSRSLDLRVLASRCYGVAVAFPFVVSPWLAISIWIFHKLTFGILFQMYQRRLIDGGLVKTISADAPMARAG